MRPTHSRLRHLKQLTTRLKARQTAAHRLRVANLLLPAVCFVVALASFNEAQQRLAVEQPDMTIDAGMRTQVIEGALQSLREAYVYPEVATRMEQAIRERVAKKEYEGITSARQLARTLTEHLQAVSRDKHLRVNYSHEPLPEGMGTGRPVVMRRGTGDGTAAAATPPPAGSDPAVIRRGAGGGGNIRLSDNPNAGIEKVERLEGNIGLLEFSRFERLPLAADKVSEAMNKLADTDALIIDLRANGGGASETIRLLMSYFFDKPVHLNDYYDRVEDRTESIYTRAEVPGKRYGDKPIYILTSRRTFSAAESISYSLKNLKRATIIGETTGGGAHPVTPRRLHTHFAVMVPASRYISPVTKTNWEGVGVEPDVKVPAAHALKVAQLAALKKLAANNADAKASAQLKALAETLQKEVDALK